MLRRTFLAAFLATLVSPWVVRRRRRQPVAMESALRARLLAGDRLTVYVRPGTGGVILASTEDYRGTTRVDSRTITIDPRGGAWLRPAV